MRRLTMVLLLLLLLPTAYPTSIYGSPDEQSVLGGGDPRILVSPGPGEFNPPIVRVFPPEEGATYILEIMAYGMVQFPKPDPAQGYSQYLPRGVHLSCGDVDGDLLDEIITGPGPSAIFGPFVRGFEGDGTYIPGLSFLAYGTRGYGVNVAAGDIDGDGFDEIITGPGLGHVLGPHVRGWNWDGAGTPTPIPGVSYLAYSTQSLGVNVTCGDIDGDGIDEIVTGSGPGTTYVSYARGWNVDGGTVEPMTGVEWPPYFTLYYGVMVTCGDVDGDNMDEILTAPGPHQMFGPHVKGWNVDGGAVTSISGISFYAFETTHGCNVYTEDLDGDGMDEIITGPGPNPGIGTPARVWDYDGGGSCTLRTPWTRLKT